MATNYISKPRKNEDPNRFIKRFIKKCNKLGIIDEYRDKRYHKKPSDVKRLAKKRAIARQKKLVQKQRRRNI
jgi:ribosomal protein S21